MYKVFIENKPVIIMETLPELNFFTVLKAQKVQSIEHQVIPLLLASSCNGVVILCRNPKDKFRKLFSEYEWIEAAGGIVQRKGRILVIKRNEKWDLPKGKLEREELPDIAAVREIEEECGIHQPQVTELLCETFHTYTFNNRSILKKTYWYLLTYSGSKKLIPQEEEGISKAKWLKISKIKKVKKNTYNSILEVLQFFEEKTKN